MSDRGKETEGLLEIPAFVLVIEDVKISESASVPPRCQRYSMLMGLSVATLTVAMQQINTVKCQIVLMQTAPRATCCAV